MKSELVKFKRLLNIDLPSKQSAFLWGARKTGKSTFLKERFPYSVRYDLLETDTFMRLLKEPHILREEILALTSEQIRHPIIIDEVQKIPTLLDEVHWLIENHGCSFILCGSSARKLKRGAANLLGGRAWRFAFFPLVYQEIPDFDLLKALNNGLIPSHYLSNHPMRSLKAYVQDYLNEEIQSEALVRSLPAFARFLDAVAFSNSELINYSNIARDCGVSAKTVKEYFQILVDTLLGYRVEPFSKKKKRDIISATPKFYLFDVGVTNALARQKIDILKGSIAGHAFEHFILMELMAYRSLSEKDFDIEFWRTKTGLEVDFVLAKGKIAIEVKITDRIDKEDLKGLEAFCEEHRPQNSFLVCNVPRPRKVVTSSGAHIMVIPWRSFLEKLWNNEIAI